MYAPDELLALYEKAFSQNNFNTSPTNLYKPVEHIMGMQGKKIRPLLLLLSLDMFGGNVEEGLNPAFAMEVFHNFTLVHDDIMDQADIRRGEPTVHKKFGTNAAILAGDVMLAYAYKYLTSVPLHHVPAMMGIFNKTAIEIFEGQQMDVDFETRTDVALDEYLKMIEYKTSVLLACCVQLGAILGNASEADQTAVYQFGLNLGLSFQIKDDLLDAFGEGEKVGKKIGGDILQNKKTYLYISTLNRCSEAQAAKLKALATEKDETIKVNGVKALTVETGAKAATEAKAEELYNLSLKSLEEIKVDESRKKVLRLMAEKINTRDY
ncbi:MAG: polyprenyl synthetase family protein [Chitinophagales bacterium]